MNTRLGLICATAVVILTGTTQAAAPVCTSGTITAGYKAGNPDPTVAPQGGFVVNRQPVAAEEFKVDVDAIVDEGPMPGRGIVVWAGLTAYTQDYAHNNAASIAYGPAALITIKNPPASLVIRGKIYYRANANAQWEIIKTVYTPFNSVIAQ